MMWTPTCKYGISPGMILFTPNLLKHILCDLPDDYSNTPSLFWQKHWKIRIANTVLYITPYGEITYCEIRRTGWPCVFSPCTSGPLTRKFQPYLHSHLIFALVLSHDDTCPTTLTVCVCLRRHQLQTVSNAVVFSKQQRFFLHGKLKPYIQYKMYKLPSFTLWEDIKFLLSIIENIDLSTYFQEF